MRRRLTIAHDRRLAADRAVVGRVLGLLAWRSTASSDAGERARQSQAVIAAANLTQQRLLAVQTNVRGFLISGNDGPAASRTAQARAGAARRDARPAGAGRRRSRAARALADEIRARGAVATSTTTPTR